jgi:beta-galactosidase GanA
MGRRRSRSSTASPIFGAASWELAEPVEGHFDFNAVDDQILQAHKRGMHLVLIWFGAYKNAGSSYAPSWVRRNEARFPRATRDPGRVLTQRFPINGPVLSVFSEALAVADARAFAALMRHIKQVDRSGTVTMMQVENEVGLLGDSRDHSPLADAAWSQPVPPALLTRATWSRPTAY